MSPCSSTPSPASSSKKLLISDLKPKSCLRKDSPSSPSVHNATPPGKRTRDLPNFSDCHCCGSRINHTNPRDRLQPLDSVWRIVLLCRKCRHNLDIGHVCPYCFEKIGISLDLCTCVICRRRIHKDCIRKYGRFTPWRFLGGEVGFSTCIDCWIPQLLRNSPAVSRFTDNEARNKGLLENMKRKVKLISNGKEHQRAAINGAANGGCHVHEHDTLDDEMMWDIPLRKAIKIPSRVLKGKPFWNRKRKDRIWKGLTYKRTPRVDKNVPTAVENEELHLPGNNDVIETLPVVVVPRTYFRGMKRKVWQPDAEPPPISDSYYRFERKYNRTRLKQRDIHDDGKASMKEREPGLPNSGSPDADRRFLLKYRKKSSNVIKPGCNDVSTSCNSEAGFSTESATRSLLSSERSSCLLKYARKKGMVAEASR